MLDGPPATGPPTRMRSTWLSTPVLSWSGFILIRPASSLSIGLSAAPSSSSLGSYSMKRVGAPNAMPRSSTMTRRSVDCSGPTAGRVCLAVRVGAAAAAAGGAEGLSTGGTVGETESGRGVTAVMVGVDVRLVIT